MSSAELEGLVKPEPLRRFAIAWRDRERRRISPVAVLDHTSTGYRFQYIAAVHKLVPSFRPFIGFPDLYKSYESDRLWPFFDLRVMDRKRPDFPEYVSWLGLTTSASRLDILSRSGGEQKGDSVYLAEAPRVAGDGNTESIFLVRGVSYAVRAYDTRSAAETLQAGAKLLIVNDASNEANSSALLLMTRDGHKVGWVPDLLIDYVGQLRNRGGEVVVLRNNHDAPWHARLLVRLSGHAMPGTRVFTGGIWPPTSRSFA